MGIPPIFTRHVRGSFATVRHAFRAGMSVPPGSGRRGILVGGYSMRRAARSFLNVTFRALIDRTEPTPPSWAAVTLDSAARTIDIVGAGEQVDLHLEY